MTGVDGNLVELRHHPINAEGLIPQLPGFHHGGGCLGRGAFRVIQNQVGSGHVPVLSIRRGHLIPAAVGLGDDLHEGAVLIGRQHLVLGARPGAQPQGAFTGFRAGEICVDPPDLRPVIVTRRGEVDTGRHGGRYRSTKDAALHQPLPFPGFIDGMHQRQFVFAVQRFRDLRRQRSQSAVAIGGEVGAVGGIDADHGDHLLEGIKKASRNATLEAVFFSTTNRMIDAF